MSVVYIRSFNSSSYYVASYTMGSWLGFSDVSHVSKRIFFWAMVRSQVASALEEIDACKQLPNMRYSSESMDYHNISLVI